MGKLGDAHAIELLIAALGNVKWEERKIVANKLVNIYLKGQLDEAHKQLIPAERGVITEPHHDEHDVALGCWSHYDHHWDIGIGVDFPL